MFRFRDTGGTNNTSSIETVRQENSTLENGNGMREGGREGVREGARERGRGDDMSGSGSHLTSEQLVQNMYI